jgi:ribosomal protein L11 methyltransferase
VAVLDVGCGSGILAVSAAVLGAGPVVAVDVDPVAVAVTTAAAAANGVAVDASGSAVGEIVGRFGLVVANIGARVLTELAPDLAARLAPGGHLVLSGLVVPQVADVVAAYASEGLAMEAMGEREGWATPVFVGKSTTSGA